MPKPDSQQSLKITPDWRTCLFALLVLPLLVSLGFWQLGRADEKAQLNALFQQRQQAGPVDISELDKTTDLTFRQVSLRGRYDDERLLLLDNRINQGQFGYEIISPFVIAGSERIVLVNRGWVAGDKSRRTLPAVQTSTELVSLSGEVYVSQGSLLVLGQQQTAGWPRVVQQLNMENLATEFGSKLYPHSVRLKAGNPGAYEPNWVVVNMQPEKHHAYAFQWFAMAAAVVIITVLLNTNIIALLKREK